MPTVKNAKTQRAGCIDSDRFLYHCTTTNYIQCIYCMADPFEEMQPLLHYCTLRKKQKSHKGFSFGLYPSIKSTSIMKTFGTFQRASRHPSMRLSSDKLISLGNSLFLFSCLKYTYVLHFCTHMHRQYLNHFDCI